MLALAQQVQHLLRVLPLRSLTTRRNNLQVRLILAHQRDRQTRKRATQEYQCNGNAQVGPEIRAIGRLGKIILAALEGVQQRAPLRQQRCGARQRQE